MIPFIFLKMQGNKISYRELSTGFYRLAAVFAGQGQRELRDREDVPQRLCGSPHSSDSRELACRLEGLSARVS